MSYFLYLGSSIGGDSRKLNFWYPLVDRIENRLSGWNISFESRLIPRNYVLSSLLVHFLSFFNALAGIISSIESIFNFMFVRIL